MQDHSLRELRRDLAGIERGPGRRYPDELKARMVAWARCELSRGATVTAAAATVALHPRTLTSWLEAAAAELALVPVEVIAPLASATSPEVAVVSPSGFRIEGLTIDEATRVLARLR